MNRSATRCGSLIAAGLLLVLSSAADDGLLAAGPAPAGDGSCELAWRYEPGTTLYLIVENEFTDSASLPMLSYTSVVRDRRTIVEKVVPSSQPTNTATVLWEFDRYEAREKDGKNEITYDSLRDLYPPPTLHDLGTIAGTRCSLVLTRGSGKPVSVSIVPGRSSGGARQSLSNTAQRCLLNNESVTALAEDLGPMFLPDSAKRIGEEWTRRLVEKNRTFGTIVTQVRCRLAAVRKSDSREVAYIDVVGDVSLEKDAPPAASSPATTGPAQPPRPPGSRRDFKLERAVYKGGVQFDVTRGRLVEMTLHRDRQLVAELEGEKDQKMQLRIGSGHVLRVKVGDTPPPKPIFVGGRKPPTVPQQELGTGLMNLRPPAPTTQKSGLTQQRAVPSSRTAAGAAKAPTQQPNAGPGSKGRPSAGRQRPQTTRPVH